MTRRCQLCQRQEARGHDRNRPPREHHRPGINTRPTATPFSRWALGSSPGRRRCDRPRSDPPARCREGPRLGRRALLAQPISAVRGVGWLLAAGVTMAAGALFLASVRWWWIVGAAAVLLSQTVIVLDWSDAALGTVPNVLLAAAVTYAYAAHGPNSLEREYHRRAGRRPNRTASSRTWNLRSTRSPTNQRRFGLGRRRRRPIQTRGRVEVSPRTLVAGSWPLRVRGRSRASRRSGACLSQSVFRARIVGCGRSQDSPCGTCGSSP
jgi:hypothetical protein